MIFSVYLKNFCPVVNPYMYIMILLIGMFSVLKSWLVSSRKHFPLQYIYDTIPSLIIPFYRIASFLFSDEFVIVMHLLHTCCNKFKKLMFLYSDLKIIVLGASAVGKTCLLQRYISNTFSETEHVREQLSTDFCVYCVNFYRP